MAWMALLLLPIATFAKRALQWSTLLIPVTLLYASLLKYLLMFSTICSSSLLGSARTMGRRRTRQSGTEGKTFGTCVHRSNRLTFFVLFLTLVPTSCFLERLRNTHMLLQSLYGASLANCDSFERCRFLRYGDYSSSAFVKRLSPSMTYNNPDITMYETLIRPHQVDILPSLPLISTVSDQLKQSEVRRETKRLRQIANSRSSKGGKRKPVADEEEDKVEGKDVRKKRVKTDEPTDNTEENPAVNLADPNTNMITTTPPPPPPPPPPSSSSSALLSLSSTVPGTERLAIDPIPVSSKQSGDTSQNDTTPSSSSSSKMSVSKAFPEVRGHTSYLTFAVLLPIFARESSSATEEAVLGEDKDKTHTATLNSVVII